MAVTEVTPSPSPSADAVIVILPGAPGLARMGDWRTKAADPFNDHEPVDASASVDPSAHVGPHVAIGARSLVRAGL